MPTTKLSPSNRRNGALIDVVVVAPAVVAEEVWGDRARRQQWGLCV